MIFQDPQSARAVPTDKTEDLPCGVVSLTFLRCISLLLPRVLKLLIQCYSNGLSTLGSLGSSEEIQP